MIADVDGEVLSQCFKPVFMHMIQNLQESNSVYSINIVQDERWNYRR